MVLKDYICSEETKAISEDSTKTHKRFRLIHSKNPRFTSHVNGIIILKLNAKQTSIYCYFACGGNENDKTEKSQQSKCSKCRFIMSTGIIRH